MAAQGSHQTEKRLCVGLLAHVDAGKTTLSEAMLYQAGVIRAFGRVDHGDTFLDTDAQERSRGITIFSKQAVLPLPGCTLTLLDTPGHVDFSAEMERTLQVLDCAVLVVSGTAGVQGHTATLWQLLRRYQVPAVVFVNKMDIGTADHDALLQSLRQELDERCIDFSQPQSQLQEELSLCDDALLDEYLASGRVSDAQIASAVSHRKVFPCFFGSALKQEGVDALLDALGRFVQAPAYGKDFGARVYKIARDEKGARLTFLKVTGGTLGVKQLLAGEDWQEKADQLRLYSGSKFTLLQQAPAGTVCAVTGLTKTMPGMTLGHETAAQAPALQPVLEYRLLLTDGTDAAQAYGQLRVLEEEDPALHLVWNALLREIRVQLMGPVQMEILQKLIAQRFGLEVAFDEGNIVYLETIAAPVEGVGHYEPLRHYAEVHLLMEPAEPGSGLQFDTMCPTDTLALHWQRLILGHLAEKVHRGVLTGAPVTDIRFTLVSGRAHQKHTEGGDFRQATYRAVRQGLMKAKSVLLEPWYAFSIELPPELIGRAISDVRQMSGSFTGPDDAGGMLRIEGSAPVSEMNGYASEVAAYSGGRGKFSCRVEGYRPCHNEKDVIVEMGYDAESDVENTADSVFCAHGGGFNVRWDKVPEYMHLESCLKKQETPAPVRRYRSLSIDERELEAIMEREFGPIKRPEYRAPAVNSAPARPIVPPKKQYIIVDGYNLIFASQELSALAREKLDLARGRLMDMLSNYCGFTKRELVLVFDGFRPPGNPGSREEYHNIHVAFTKDGETADAYIERFADNIGKNYDVRVVTNDNLIRLSALRSGVLRTSSDEFALEVRDVLEQIDALLKKTNYGAHKYRLELDRTENGEK